MAKLENVEKKRLRNKAVRTNVKTTTAKAASLIEEKKVDEAKAAVVVASSSLDKAAKKGVIHPNKAARRKSRLMKKLNQASKTE